MKRSTFRLLDVTIDNLTRSQALDRAEGFLRSGDFHHIVTPGPEFLLEATAHDQFRAILNRADLSLADGMGLHFGARFHGYKLQTRIPGADFIDDLMFLAARLGSRIFLFGGRPGIAERAAITLLRRHPKLNIVGTESGSRGHWSSLEDRRVVERIHLARPDILMVALGAPKQELWIDRHRPALHRVSIAMGVGRTFDYLAGAIKRAPRLVRQSGFEWLYTYLTAAQYHQPRMRRRRVGNATYRFIIEMIGHRHDSRV